MADRQYTFKLTDKMHSTVLIGLMHRIDECKERIKSSPSMAEYWQKELDECKELEQNLLSQWSDHMKVLKEAREVDIPSQV